MSEQARSRVWVVVAAYNEARVIGEVVRDLVDGGWRVVVVDDGSDDATAEIARTCGATVLRHVFNLGQGAALQTGVDYALQQNAAVVVTFDADGQHRVEDLPALVQALEGADVALGSRALGEAQGATRSRRLLLRLATVVSNKLSGLKLSDAHCGLRAFRSDTIRQLRIRQPRMAHASEILSLLKQSGARITEVPVSIRYTEYSRRKGQSGMQAIRILFDHFFRT